LGKIISIEVLNKEKLKIKEGYFISKLNFTVHDLLTREENQFCFKKSNKMFCVKINFKIAFDLEKKREFLIFWFIKNDLD